MELIFMYFFLVLSLFIFWCINEKVGIQLGIVLALLAWIVLIYSHFKELVPVNIDLKWIIIAVIFCGYFFLRNKIDALISRGGFRAYTITTAAVSFIMILYRPGWEFVIPGGCLLGLGIGYCLNKRYVGFASAAYLQREGSKKYLTMAARFLLGIAVLAVIVIRVNIVIHQLSESQNAALYCFLCYAVTCLWISIAAPWVFTKLHLAGTVQVPAEPWKP
ncbi:MAG: hypothetical protein FWD40_06050 [Treponema sp.]|nr:hypothetical protein [Treponema sp.]